MHFEPGVRDLVSFPQSHETLPTANSQKVILERIQEFITANFKEHSVVTVKDLAGIVESDSFLKKMIAENTFSATSVALEHGILGGSFHRMVSPEPIYDSMNLNTFRGYNISCIIMETEPSCCSCFPSIEAICFNFSKSFDELSRSFGWIMGCGNTN